MEDSLKPPKAINLSALDLCTILYNLHVAASYEEIGFQDCYRTLDELTHKLAMRSVPVRTELLESALWASVMLDENGEFWSPRGESFNKFIGRLFRRYGPELYYDQDYCQIKMDMKRGIK